jgi:hypothetical protein
LTKSEIFEHLEAEHSIITQDDQGEFYMGVGKNPFWLKEQNFMLWFHIINMTLSFGTLIPIGIVLSISNIKSKWYINVQIIGIILAIVGFFSGVTFKHSKSQDIYPNNFHSKFGWVVLIVLLIQITLGFIKFIQNDDHKVVRFVNISNESNESLSVDDSSTSSHDIESLAQKSLLYDSNDSKKEEYKFRSKVRSLFSKKKFKIIYNIISFTLIILIYSQFLLGFITLSDTCHGESLGNCLAHYIKGSLFFWFGLIAFVRYLGFFENFGWEWNLLPSNNFDDNNEENRNNDKITFSLIESFIIFSYGIINTFLEHTGKDPSWHHRDIQHATLAFMW